MTRPRCSGLSRTCPVPLIGVVVGFACHPAMGRADPCLSPWTLSLVYPFFVLKFCQLGSTCFKGVPTPVLCALKPLARILLLLCGYCSCTCHASVYFGVYSHYCGPSCVSCIHCSIRSIATLYLYFARHNLISFIYSFIYLFVFTLC